MIEGLRKYYTGDWNSVFAELQADGSQIITLTKDGENVAHRFQVRNLYREDERVLKHEEITIEQPAHIKKRMKEALLP